MQNLLKEYPHQNFLVQTSYVKALIRIKHEIDNHQAGFAIAEKALPEIENLNPFKKTACNQNKLEK